MEASDLSSKILPRSKKQKPAHCIQKAVKINKTGTSEVADYIGLKKFDHTIPPH